MCRPYSLCTSPYLDEPLAVTVKRVPDGRVSNYLNDHLRIGDTLAAIPPAGNFTTSCHPHNQRHLALFGGGSGITPLMAIIKSALHQALHTMVSLIYANRHEQAIIFKNQLDYLKKRYSDRFNVVYSLDDPPKNWSGIAGKLNPYTLKKIVKTLPDFGKKNTEYFICGPEGFMHVAMCTLQDIGIPQEKILKESFLIDHHHAPNLEKSLLATHKVMVIYEGEKHTFTVPPKKTILQTALENDIDLPFSCQSGLCTACRGKCLSGKVKLENQEGLDAQALQAGYVLTCVAYPLTDDVVIEIE